MKEEIVVPWPRNKATKEKIRVPGRKWTYDLHNNDWVIQPWTRTPDELGRFSRCWYKLSQWSVVHFIWRESRRLETTNSEFVLDFVYKIPGVFKNKKLSFQGIFVRRFLCHTSCCSVFFAEKAYLDILSHVLWVKCTHGHFIFCI